MIINISNPLTAVLLLAATVLLIFLGKESRKSRIPQILLVIYLAMLIMHVVQLMTISVSDEIVNSLYKCIALDFVFTLITFLSYLWVDEIEAKSIGKKSIDNSLDWFWKKV